MEDVDPMSAGRVVLPGNTEVACVALAADTPVTMTAVPVAATPLMRPLVVLFAYGASERKALLSVAVASE